MESLVNTYVQEVDQDVADARVYVYEMNLSCPGIAAWEILQSFQQNLWELILLVIRTKVCGDEGVSI